MTRPVSSAPSGPRGWAQGRTGLVWFLFGGLVVAAVNAGFQRLAASRVDVDDLGALNALLALVGGVGLLGLGLQVVLARAGTARLALVRAALLIGLVSGAVAAGLVPGPSWYRISVGAALGASFSAVFIGVPHRARLLADASWRRLALTYVSGAVVRLVAMAPLLALIENRLVAAMVATALGEAVTSTTAWVLARPQYRGDWSERPHRIDAATARLLLRASLSLGGLWVLTVADTVVARRRLPAMEADAYAFASTVARSTFFLAVLLAHFALPTFMSERGRSTGLRRAFGVTVVTIAAGAVAMSAVLLVAPIWTSELLLGVNGRSVDPGTLRVLAVAWALMSLLPLLTYFHLDRHPRVAFVPLAGAVASLVAGMLANDPRSFAVSLLVVVLVCVVVMAVPASQRLAPVIRSTSWQPSVAPRHVSGSDVTIVVPFYNPGAAVVVDTVRRLLASLASVDVVHRVIAVSDGSTDGSAEALGAAAFEHVEVVVLPANRGKGAALRAGLERSSGSFIGYIDADGDLPPEQIAGMIDIAAATGADAVVGSKLHPDSRLDVEGYRRVLSTIFRGLVRVLFRLDVRDTQTGLKLYRGDVLTAIVPMLREDGFAIDVEILVAAIRTRRVSIVEAPVQLARGVTTTMSPRRAAATIVGLGRIFWRDHVALAYEPHVIVAPVAAVP